MGIALSPAPVWGLGLTQIIGYGTLYYSFSILAPGMAKDFDWPQEWVFGIFSALLAVLRPRRLVAGSINMAQAP